MIIASSGHFDVFVCHSDVFGIDFQVIWGSHYNELDRPFISKCFVRPNKSMSTQPSKTWQRSMHTTSGLTGSL